MRESRKSGFCEGRTTVRGASTRHLTRLVSEEFKETNKKMPVYVVNENVILESCTSKESQYDRIKALLLLKGEAKIADKNYYVADSKFSGFGKNYLVGEEME